MGTWGEGNFDNDYACGYLDSIINQLIETVERGLSLDNRETLDLDEVNEKLMPSLDIVISLCEHYRAFLQLEENVVIDWKNEVLHFYDANIDYYGAKDEYKIGRRKVIEETFSKLERLAHDWENL